MFHTPTEDQIDCIVASTRILELLSACGNDIIEVCWYTHIHSTQAQNKHDCMWGIILNCCDMMFEVRSDRSVLYDLHSQPIFTPL